MLPRLEARFDVLAVDLPGFGHSDPSPPGVDSTPEVLADAVEDEMRRAGFERAHFAGNSLLRYMRGLGHTPMSDAPDELAERRARRQAIRPR